MFAASQGWIVEDYFEDRGFSGATLDRPGLQKLLRVVRHLGTDRILVHRLDRLSRNLRDCVKLLDEFRCLGADLVIVTASELGHAAQDHFLLNIMASFAEFEREMIVGRIADARARLKAEGAALGWRGSLWLHSRPAHQATCRTACGGGRRPLDLCGSCGWEAAL